MTGDVDKALALIVQTRPYENRSARVNIDLALAAAAMNFDLHIYFTGTAIMQLACDRDSSEAMLSAGFRAWAALPELADTIAYGESSWVEYCQQMEIALVMPIQALSASEMKINWRRHDEVMVI